jgi:peptide/nickel transport system substrate-binding protein
VPRYGGTLRASTTTTNTHLDFQQAGGPGSTAYTINIAYSGLVKFKVGPEIKPPAYVPVADLAQSWDQPDDVTYVFKLRPGVKFHNIAPVNGRELVAEDIVFSFTRQRDLRANAAPLTNILRMEAPDKYTFKLTLERPNADLLLNLADDGTKAIAREQVDQKGDLKEGPVIGTGPWIVENAEPGKFDNLVRNADYFTRGIPYLDRLEILHPPDTTTAIAALRSNAVDLLGPTLLWSDYEPLSKAVPQLKANLILQSTQGHDMGLNVSKPPFQDVRVRQAVLKAVDFQLAIDTVMGGKGELTTGVVLPDESWKLPKEELQRLLKRDVEAAKRLLNEAGMASGFEAECIFVPTFNSGALQTYSELFQQQLREIGVKLNLKPVPATDFTGLATRGDFQMYVDTQRGQSSANADLLGRYHSKGPTNWTRINDPMLDDLIERQSVVSRDPEARKRLLQEIQRYVVDRAFKIGITSPIAASMYWPHVRDYWPSQHPSHAGDYWTYLWLDR